ncbi:hypothetical protein DOJK_00988 [Patescibacteria group bacterium]|nr:hypothetical protein DOJK_00988 [Patescibacteria group bacterium]
MQTNILDLSPLSSPLQQEIIDFYEFLLEKQAKNKILAQTDLDIANKPVTGFAMLKTNKTAVPADFDPASLLNHDRA